MSNSLVVEVLNGHRDLGCIELDSLLVEAFLACEDLVELPSSNIRHHKVKPEGALKEVVHGYQERMIT